MGKEGVYIFEKNIKSDFACFRYTLPHICGIVENCASGNGFDYQRSGDYEDLYETQHLLVGRGRAVADGMDRIYSDGDWR
jgi:hypothetical protein